MWWRPGRRRTRGQSLVEFALVLAPLLLLIGGIVEFGRAYSFNEAVVNAARDGARMASLHDGGQGTSSTATPQYLSNASPPASASVQAQVVNSGAPATIVNNSSLSPNIRVAYYMPSTSSSSTTYCGWYNPVDNQIESAAIGTASGAAGLSSSCTGYSVSNMAGLLVDVKVSFTYYPLTPLLKGLMSNGITTTSDAEMIIEAT